MAHVVWFQKKIILLSLFGFIALIIFLRVLCSSDSQDAVLQRTKYKISQLQFKLQRLQEQRKSSTSSDVARQAFLPTLFLITPTYSRHTQQADLVRMSNTLKQVDKLHWIVVEDSEKQTDLVANILKESGTKFEHLNTRTQSDLARQQNDPRWKKHRGVDQRNLGLSWIRKNILPKTMGVVYFADDDNTYHLDLFSEMRWTKRVSMWPVALVGGLRWEGPVCKNGKVIKFFTAWMPQRNFPVDMAAFAVNMKLLFEYPKCYINAEVQRGWLETNFLQQLGITKDDVDAKANDCSRILVWHTQTAEPNMKEEIRLGKMGKGSNPNIVI